MILDLFCGAGGASLGYHRAGITDIVGVDIEAQPHYPFHFIQANALSNQWSLMDVDFVHASPPCQRYSVLTPVDNDHPDLVAETRNMLKEWGVPYVMENVPSAPMRRDLMLCGSMFGLQVQRHRIFEFGNGAVIPPALECNHEWSAGRPVTVTGNPNGPTYSDKHSLKYRDAAHAAELMEMPYGMPNRAYTEAIPPAYTHYIGVCSPVCVTA